MYIKVVDKAWFKTIVLVAFAGILGVGISGVSQLRIEGDEDNFIPDVSHQWLKSSFDIVLHSIFDASL